MLLPSVRSTIKSSAVTLISCARATISAFEVRIPCLHKSRAILIDYFFQFSQFRPLETTRIHKSNRTEPKFRRTSFSLHMNMWRFISLVAVEEEPIRPNDFHCGHYYESLSHRPAKQGIKFSVVSHPFRRSRANAPAKLRALNEKEVSRQLQPVVRSSFEAH